MASWLLDFGGRPQATFRLVCLSSAGSGAAMYRPWRDALPADVDVCAVQLPGRENRLREPPVTSITALADALARELAPALDRPYAIFGHSMGALLAYLLVHRLARAGAPTPELLFVSGHRAPHLPDDATPVHGLPDDALIAEIGRRYDGIPAEVLQHRDLLELLLPTLRADLTAVETYRHVDLGPLSCPLVACGGSADRRASAEQLGAWKRHTVADFRQEEYPGGHFYLQNPLTRSRLLAQVLADLARVRRSGGGWRGDA